MRPAALSESLGDYLEVIYHIVQQQGVARVKQIAERMEVQMPSVNGALKALAERGLVNHDPYSLITLTASGKAAAMDLVRRHEKLTEFFVRVLGLDEATAERNACHVEHAIEPKVLDRLVAFLETTRK